MLYKTIIDRMTEELLISKSELLYLARTSPYRYKVFTIPKRKPGEFRTIAQPAREVKRLQYWVLKNILKKMSIHEAATAYNKGNTIAKNAEIHAKNPYLLKIDFKDFFPSIKAHDFRSFIDSYKDIHGTEEEKEMLTNILFWKQKYKPVLQLSIGAPTSPYLSNILMYEFDTNISKICKNENIAYSRYADDLAFSSQNKEGRNFSHSAVLKLVRELKSPLLQINKDKTVFTSRAGRRRITGLILTPDENISIGRGKKREISAMIHRYKMNNLISKEQMRLHGLIGFASDIEPNFIKSMKQKYGEEIIEAIKKLYCKRYP